MAKLLVFLALAVPILIVACGGGGKEARADGSVVVEREVIKRGSSGG